jgi:hypothetical protein
LQLTFYLSVLVEFLAETSELSIDIIVCHGERLDALYKVWFRFLESWFGVG